MKKLIATTILMSLLSVSCNSGGSSSGSTASTNAASAEASKTVSSGSGSTASTPTSGSGANTTAPAPVANVPALALSFQTHVDLMNFNASQASKYNQAVALVKKVVATEKFKNQILNYTWNGSQKFASTNLSNAQIYQSLLDAAETLQPAKNNTMDLGVQLYTEASNIIGFTNPSITYINVNTKYFDTFAINEVAGNLFHEWTHKLGYDHDFSATPQRPYSVPYAIGYMIRDIGKAFL